MKELTSMFGGVPVATCSVEMEGEAELLHWNTLKSAPTTAIMQTLTTHKL